MGVLYAPRHAVTDRKHDERRCVRDAIETGVWRKVPAFIAELSAVVREHPRDWPPNQRLREELVSLSFRKPGDRVLHVARDYYAAAIVNLESQTPA